MALSPNTPEARKPSLSEAVDRLIEKTGDKQKSSSSLEKGVSGVQSEVAEVMAGVEAPKEGVSERKGDSGEKGDIKASSGASQDQGVALDLGMEAIEIPSEEVMIKKIREAIKEEIAHEWKIAKQFRGNLSSGGAAEYSSAMARIRSLHHKLSTLFEATYDYVKGLYLDYFSKKKEGKKAA